MAIAVDTADVQYIGEYSARYKRILSRFELLLALITAFAILGFALWSFLTVRQWNTWRAWNERAISTVSAAVQGEVVDSPALPAWTSDSMLDMYYGQLIKEAVDEGQARARLEREVSTVLVEVDEILDRLPGANAKDLKQLAERATRAMQKIEAWDYAGTIGVELSINFLEQEWDTVWPRHDLNFDLPNSTSSLISESLAKQVDATDRRIDEAQDLYRRLMYGKVSADDLDFDTNQMGELPTNLDADPATARYQILDALSSLLLNIDFVSEMGLLDRKINRLLQDMQEPPEQKLGPQIILPNSSLR